MIVTLGFLLIYLVSKWQWTLNVAFIVGILGLFSAYLARKIDFLWMKLAWLLSLIVPNVLLSLVFFMVLTPVAWLSGIFGRKDQLSLKNTNDSLFKEYNKKFDKAYFEKPW
ncbi:MAG: hypothetical protein L3J66_06145 [Bacteroidales bacterium]|nr:hypothetical protein [Bacteroidales bacterium]